MHINQTEAEYIHKRIISLPTKEERKAYAAIVPKAEALPIVTLWKQRIVEDPLRQAETVLLTFVLRWLLVAQPNQGILPDCTPQQVAGIARYIELTHDYSHTLDIIDILFLEQGCDEFSHCLPLFQTLTRCIPNIPTDELRDMACQNMVEMLLKNPALSPYCCQPYYFLEYLLHLINQESDIDRQIYWCQCLKELYLNANPEHLWDRNDFHILVDVIVRQIENAPSQNALATNVETYLVFSIVPYLIKDHAYYKLDLVIEALSALPDPTPRVAGYLQQLQSLAKEKH